MSWTMFAALGATVGIAAFVQGAIGIGFALIVAPVLGLVRPDLLPVCLLLLMLPLNLHVAWRERRAIDRAGVGWITAGRLVGTLGGLWVLTALSAASLNLLIGVATMAAALAALAAPAFAPKAGSCVAAGLVTGVTETATGVGGPPLALLYQHRPAANLRATIAVCFFVGEVVSLALLAAAGRLGLDQVLAAALFLPAVAAGSLASRVVHQKLDGGVLRIGVLLFALVSGAFLLLPG
jgi:uncharacterized membrane protein YfcA